MTTQLYRVGEAAVTVADPVYPYVKRRMRNASSQRALDGTLITQQTTHKYGWDVIWQGLTSAQKTTLFTELDRSQAMTWKPPDEATTYTVHVVSEIVIEPTDATLEHWNITAGLEEV